MIMKLYDFNTSTFIAKFIVMLETYFARPRRTAWCISTPLCFSVGELEKQTTPIRIYFAFSGWHNALSSSGSGQICKLINLFNIIIIMKQMRGKHLSHFGTGNPILGDGRDLGTRGPNWEIASVRSTV
jgi:hypothetical protein